MEWAESLMVLGVMVLVVWLPRTKDIETIMYFISQDFFFKYHFLFSNFVNA